MNMQTNSTSPNQASMMRQIGAIWMQPVYQRFNMEEKKALLGLIAVMPLLGLVTALCVALYSDAASRGQTLWIASSGFALDLFLICITWFMGLVSTAAQQYTPANASLLPHLKRNLQWALAIPVITLPLLPAATALLLDNKVHFALVWFIFAIGASSVVATIRSPIMFLIACASSFLPMLSKRMQFAFPSLLKLTTPMLLIPVAMLVVAGVLHWTFKKSETLFKRKDRINKMREAIKENTGSDVFGLQQMLASPYRFLLNRKLMRKANPAQLLPFCLGPRLHWTSVILQIVGMTISMSVFVIFIGKNMTFSETESERFPFIFMFLLVFLITPVAYVASIQNTLYQTRGEQALMSLSPAVTSINMQNRLVFQHILKQYFFMLAAIFVFTIIACELLVPSEVVRHAIYLIYCSLLPLSLLLTRHYGKMQSVLDTRMVRALLAVFALAGASIFAVLGSPSIPYWIVCGAIVLVSAVLMAQKWKKLMRMPAIFPVGRSA